MKTRELFEASPYETTFKAKVLAIGDLGIVLDSTLFYPTGGGQPGDTGYLFLPNGARLRILGTKRDSSDRAVIWHQVDDTESLPLEEGMELEGKIDWEPRYQYMKMHTCLHLLCSIIDAPVTGCGIGQDKGRLDFDLPVITLDKEDITNKLNALIEAEIPVNTYYASEQMIELAQKPGTARPPVNGPLRIVDVAGIDLQPCGGTHVRNTREIGLVVCDKIEKKSVHNRRVSIRFS